MNECKRMLWKYEIKWLHVKEQRGQESGSFNKKAMGKKSEKPNLTEIELLRFPENGHSLINTLMINKFRRKSQFLRYHV